MIPQLPLALGLKDSAAFDSYLAGPNGEALACLKRLAERTAEADLYLWGAAGTGKSHLLQAACRAVGERGLAAAYLPLQAADQFPSEMLEGLEQVALVCLDDVQAIAGRTEWELALVRLFERCRHAGSGLVVAGDAAPVGLGLGQAQLRSRLAGALVLQLRPLTEDEMLQALALHAARRGFELPVETGRYLVRHYGPDPDALFAILDSLDRASLAAKRRLTIPFVRAALKETGGG